MTDADHKRSVRVAERIRAELMDLLLRGDVHDPGARGVFVTEVKVSDDLSHAHVYLRLLDSEPSPKQRRAVVSAMGRASGFMRSKVAARLKMKRVPDLEFHWDDLVDRADRVEKLLDEIRGEADPRPEEP